MYNINPIDIIVFSKNRPAQLHLMLRSFFTYIDFPCTITVLYDTSPSKFEDGYEIVKAHFPEISFIKGKELKPSILSLLSSNLCMFLSDDGFFRLPMIEKDKILLNSFENNEHLVSLSFSLGREVFCKWDITGPESKIAQVDNYNMWGWNINNRQQYDLWFNPMQLIGNLFRTDDIKPIISSIEFNTVIELDQKMSQNSINRPCCMCFDQAKYCELAANTVQTQRIYPSTDILVDILLINFLNRKMIKFPDETHLPDKHTQIKTDIIFEFEKFK